MVLFPCAHSGGKQHGRARLQEGDGASEAEDAPERPGEQIGVLLQFDEVISERLEEIPHRGLTVRVSLRTFLQQRTQLIYTPLLEEHSPALYIQNCNATRKNLSMTYQKEKRHM